MDSTVDSSARGPGLSSGNALAPPAADDLPLTVIERRQGWQVLNLRELWRYRELYLVLSWRDVKVRYKQTALGIAWAVLQPLSVTLVMSVFFFRLAELRSGGVPYPLFAYAGMLPWTFFATAINHAGQSVVGNQALVTKVYFPRLLLPFSAILVALIDFMFALTILIVLMFLEGRPPQPGFFVYVPLVTLLLAVLGMGVGTMLAALTVAYRDVRHALPFLVQLWMLATPSIYLRELAAENPRWGYVLPLNPVDGIITNFRAAALGLEFNYYALAISGGLSVAVFVAACFYFRRVERSFADII